MALLFGSDIQLQKYYLGGVILFIFASTYKQNKNKWLGHTLRHTFHATDSIISWAEKVPGERMCVCGELHLTYHGW